MQIFALDQNGERISVNQANRHLDYCCLECNERVRLKGGFQRRLHFFHLEKSPSCKLSERSSLHLSIQNHLYSLFKNDNCILERKFAEIQRVADVSVENKKWIFEIQCSPISYKEISMRSSQYLSCGYQIFWILHEKSFLNRSITEAEHYLRFRPHFYTNINESGEGLIYDSLLNFCRGNQSPLNKHEIDLQRFYSFPKDLSKSALPWVRARKVLWPGYFHNDCLYHIINNSNPKRRTYYKGLKFASSILKTFYKFILELSC